MRKTLTILAAMILLLIAPAQGMQVLRAEEGAKTYTVDVDGRKAVDPVVDLGSDAGDAGAIAASCNNYTGTLPDCPVRNVLVYSASDNTLSWSIDEYNKLTTKEKRLFMEYTLKTIRDSGMPAQARNKMYNFVEKRDISVSKALTILEEDYKPDIVGAEETLNKLDLMNRISTAMGFLLLMVFGFLALTMLIDIFYISLAPFRMFVDRMTGDNKTTLTSKLISHEAHVAIENSEGYGQGNAVLSYLTSKSLSVGLLAAIVMLLVTGNLFNIIIYIMEFIDLVLQVFGIQ